MSIVAFIKRVVSSLGKKDVRSKLTQLHTALTTILFPALVAYQEGLVERQFKSAAAKAFIAHALAFWPQLYRNEGSPFGKILSNALTNADILAQMLGDYVKSNLPESIQVEGLTYQRASILRVIELLDFLVDYSMRNLAMMTAAETNLSVFEKPDGNPFPKGEMAWLKANETAYIQTVAFFLKDPKLIIQTLDTIPDIYVDADPGVTPALSRGAEDPLQMGSIAGISWIFHFVGVRIVDWEIGRYERMQKEKQSIQLRLESLRSTARGTPDARTQAVIEGYERELVLTREKLARIEEKIK